MSTVPVHFHPSQHPEAVKSSLLARLRGRQVPARFLYDSPAQAARWLTYHAAWSPSRTETELVELYRSQMSEALDAMAGPLGYVGVGCGGGTKDALFIAEAGPRLAAFTLADTSPSLVLHALSRVQAPPTADSRGLVVDLECSPLRDEFAGRRPTVWSAFGMVPNLDVGPFLSWFASMLGPKDRGLISANLHPAPCAQATPDILPQYDNPPARAWYRGALRELGIEVEPRVRTEALSADGENWRVVVDATVPTDVKLEVFDAIVELRAGEQLTVFRSHRFTPSAFEAQLRASGLEPIRAALFDNHQEGIWTVLRGVNPGSKPR